MKKKHITYLVRVLKSMMIDDNIQIHIQTYHIPGSSVQVAPFSQG